MWMHSQRVSRNFDVDFPTPFRRQIKTVEISTSNRHRTCIEKALRIFRRRNFDSTPNRDVKMPAGLEYKGGPFS